MVGLGVLVLVGVLVGGGKNWRGVGKRVGVGPPGVTVSVGVKTGVKVGVGVGDSVGVRGAAAEGDEPGPKATSATTPAQ